MPIDDFNADALAGRLLANRLHQSRLGRFLRDPVKLIVIYVTRLLHITFPVSLPLLWGDWFRGFIPEAVSAIIWRQRSYEHETSIYLTKYLRPGCTFVDVGAHFGYFTLLASRLVGPSGHVVAIEPMPHTYKLLQENISINELGNVYAVNIAASNKAHTVVFRDFGIIHSSLNTSSTARGIMLARERRGTEVRVNADTLDSILSNLGIDRVDMIKIDAESSEAEVLVGLEHMLVENSPTLIVEAGGNAVDEGLRVEGIFSFLEELRYTGHRFDGMELTSIEPGRNLPYMNVIFIRQGKSVSK